MTKEKALAQLREQTNADFQKMFNPAFENLFNELWGLGYGLSCAYLIGDSVSLSIIAENNNLPEIIASGWQSKEKITFKVQTFSAGALGIAELEAYLAGYEIARKAINILESFDFAALWQSRD